MRWLDRWRRWRDDRVFRQRPIPEHLWTQVLQLYPFIQARSVADRTALHRLASLFLAEKEFTGAQGLRVTDEMAVAVAAQACLPVLKLGLQAYSRFVGIVVQPDIVLAKRAVEDEDGLVHEYDEELSGEAMAGGPVMLAWPDVLEAGATAADAYNVVIHEFAHVLDERFGWSGPSPTLPPGLTRAGWCDLLVREYEVFAKAVDRGDATLLDPYGAEAPEEFFAVASEAFFVNTAGLRRHHPDLHRALVRLYGQDPGGG